MQAVSGPNGVSLSREFDPSALRGSRLGRYELLACIGKGGMASVWVARDTTGQQSQPVAIKVIREELAKDSQARTMFLVEGAVVAGIRHPHVVRVYEVSQDDGILYMVMEWVEGAALHALISEANRRRPIPPEHAVRLIADTAAGLHAAHELRDPRGMPRNLVHCDTSPQNILVGLDGTVKLVDFGVASTVGRIGSDSAPFVRGKVGYMSPEQTRGEVLDRRSDLFSLGIVLFELTTGFRLFRGADNRQTIELVRRAKVPQPTQVLNDYPAELEAIVLKALERDIDKRFQSAEQLQESLQEYLRAQRIVVPPAGIGGLVKRVLGPRIEHHRGLIREAVAALDGGEEARTAWLAQPQAPPPAREQPAAKEAESGTVRASRPPRAATRTLPPPVPQPVPPPAAKARLSSAQIGWAVWATFIAACLALSWRLWFG